jgi:hypothetical protein
MEEVRTIEREVVTKPLVVEQVKAKEIEVEETNVYIVVEYIHFIIYHFPRISSTESKV